MPSSRPARVLVLAVLAAVLGVLLPAAAAHAAERTVRGGRLDWGIKSSFQSYVTGPVAHGSWSLTGGAATVGGSRFRFHSATGAYDPDSGDFRSAFSGGVHFTGHPKPDGTDELDLAIARPSVRIDSGRGTLYADMTSKAKGSGQVTTRSQVPLASLALAGIDLKGGSTPIALDNIPATLTSQGAEAFAGYYPAGTALDPVSLSVDTEGAPDRPVASNPPTPSASSSSEAEAGAPGGFADAAVDWGVRRTFREYVDGPVAQGRWTVSAGARDGGALFRFPSGKGAYDERKGTLDAAFAGAVRFTGKQLDITLDRVAVKVADGAGTLSAGGRPLVTFPARLAAKDGLVSIAEAPAKLTAEGAGLFGGMYPAGTEMDPVSLAVAVDPKAKLPALPDLGSGASASPQAPSPSPVRPAAEPAAQATSSGGGPGAVAYAGMGVAVLAAAGAAFVRVRRRRAAAAEAAAADDPAGD
ncbi:HtaA domain-containing protein [Streptomyces sp. HUAS TT7]|uniref:HtaA domain-containing protein n=1 Tax=Streptomyces sp. HUAS TT7 TaxID=3447507 RepID=UPI003F658E2F